MIVRDGTKMQSVYGVASVHDDIVRALFISLNPWSCHFMQINSLTYLFASPSNRLTSPFYLNSSLVMSVVCQTKTTAWIVHESLARLDGIPIYMCETCILFKYKGTAPTSCRWTTFESELITMYALMFVWFLHNSVGFWCCWRWQITVAHMLNPLLSCETIQLRIICFEWSTTEKWIRPFARPSWAILLNLISSHRIRFITKQKDEPKKHKQRQYQIFNTFKLLIKCFAHFGLWI